MPIATHHAEWLSLLETAGPFLSIPALNRAFPQGLDAMEPDQVRNVRLAYDEWRDNMDGARPEAAIHNAWLRYILWDVLEYSGGVLKESQAIPDGIKVTMAQYNETLRPDLMLADPENGRPCLLIQLYPKDQRLDDDIDDRRWKASPIARMEELLRATDIRLGLISNGAQWILIHAPRGETTGSATWPAEMWGEEPITLRAFQSLLSARRFFNVPPDQTLEALLAESVRNQQEVTEQLGYQVRQAVQILIQSIDRADQDRGRALLADVPVDELYEAALTVMMRLVFLFSAEEKRLIVLTGDAIYDDYYAASTLGGQLREQADQLTEEVLERGYDAWCRLLALFRGIYGGVAHDRLQSPAYGGSLFDPDRFPFLEGRTGASTKSWTQEDADPLPINNRTVLHLLEAIGRLKVRIPGGGYESRKLSFRALDIEQIGHVYEGLLDHRAVRAPEVMVGLIGKEFNDKEIALAGLEQLAARGEDALLLAIKDLTKRSEAALRRALTSPPVDPHRRERLLVACHGDQALYERVLPFFGILREDDLGYAVVIPAGSVYVTEGTDRRESGTHYTPRSLTEPIVQRTLEPLVYHGPAQGLPRDQWTLRPSSELLGLKICDMAMGSGAFLVQTCRYLAERLIEAWGNEGVNEIAPMPGTLPGTELHIQPMPKETEERLTIARRLIADRCLYGVDKNPLAVEMAKLSLWLITMAQRRPFTFLDHALRCGDSLVGVSVEQLRRWALHAGDQSNRLFSIDLQERLDKAIEARRELESRPVLDINDLRDKEFLLARANAEMNDMRAAADMLILSYMNDLSNADQEALRLDLLDAAKLGHDVPEQWRGRVTLGDLKPFHWELEFPEVFQRENAAGFDAFVGNPPFVGGSKIRGSIGGTYLKYLTTRWEHAGGQGDLSAYFFLRDYEHLRPGGTLGLIATNTIAQGDTREMGLEYIVNQGGIIYNATNNKPWPGTAAVVINVVHIAKDTYQGELALDDQPVETITSFLDNAAVSGTPFVLKANANLSFEGSKVTGMGFIMTPDEAQALIDKDLRNRDVLFPYLNGEDLNQRPDQSPSRWVINFFDWDLEQAEQYPDCMAIVREKVYPERTRLNEKGEFQLRAPLPQKWWIYGEKRPALYHTIAPLERVLVATRVSAYHIIAPASKGRVFSDRLAVLAFEQYSVFSLLTSVVHESWAHRPGSTTHETRLTYFPESSFETFPFPIDISNLESIGEHYHETRRAIMLERWEGLTNTYNRFHNPKESSADIAGLRALHVEMDQQVAAAYGWSDLNLGHGFHETAQGVRFTVHAAARRELLARLLRLNHERHEAELLSGLHDKGAKGAKKAKAKATNAAKGQPVASQPSAGAATDADSFVGEQIDMFPDNDPKQKRLL